MRGALRSRLLVTEVEGWVAHGMRTETGGKGGEQFAASPFDIPGLGAHVGGLIGFQR